VMGVLLRYPLETSGDVTFSGQLTRDVAREAGLASLQQSKLATVVAGLARRCLASAAAGEVVFSVEGTAGDLRLVVAVSEDAAQGAGLVDAQASTGRGSLGLELHSLRRLVDDLEQTGQPDGCTRVTATVRLEAQRADELGLIRRVKALRPAPRPAMTSPHKAKAFSKTTVAQTQSKKLEQATAELERVNQERVGDRADLKRVNAEKDAVNAELALTNRGVLDLVAELSAANESLSLTGARYRQLADQQSALADLGHRAVASHDITMLATGLVGVLRRVLGVQLVGVLRFKADTPALEIVASEGYDPELPATISLNRQQARKLQREGTDVVDLTERPGDFPLPTPPGSRSCAVAAVHTPAGPWGVLVTSDRTPDRYTATTTAFLEAAASLLAFSIARMASEGATQHAALHDGLTGLPNRAHLLEHMGSALDNPAQLSKADDPGLSKADDPGLSKADDPGPSKAVIFLDIDGFKQVNDTAGHAAGDQVLKETATRLRSVMRPADVLARLGGDEFVALCEGGAEAAEAISRRLLSAFDKPFIIDGREVFLSASAGLTLVEAGAAADQILADADIAMYQAKLVPGSATAVFNPQMRSFADSESHLYSELRQALGRGQLRAVYQPVVDLGNGSVCAVETLLRWQHPDLGDVPAQQTVAAAERIGLAWELTCWIAAEAARTISAWNSANPAHPPLRLAVNFTPLLLGDPERVGELEAVVTAAGLPFSLLDVELTETAFVDPTPCALDLLADLRRRGVRLSMDDFGTGYSSLMTVATLPLDVLKIDRSFVTPLQIGGDTLLVAAMTGIARGRGLETIGEGIETSTQLAALIAAECDLGQGYLFAKPLEKDQLQSLAALESGFADTIRAARPLLVGDSVIEHSQAAGDMQTARVLVVEQNLDDLEVLQSILRGSVRQITGLSDPAGFDAAVRDTQPDLILMGLRFRGTTGFDLVEHAEALLTMPVVAVTGLPDWALHNEPRSFHFSAIIHKPVDPGELLTHIQDLLTNHPHHLTKQTIPGHIYDSSPSQSPRDRTPKRPSH
jgi:diguanylate cyclase (GGDEF)-like protein